MDGETQSKHFLIGAARFDAPHAAPGLHIVATPIGNLGDITVRALETLAGVDTILCEDTRVTAKLLARYSIRNRLQALHDHNERQAAESIVARLREGQAYALVSDAGVPLVSDPGYRLVQQAIAEGIAVNCCPGPSAVLTALALAGLPTDRFAFFGFLPQKQGERESLFAELRELQSTLVFFESPHRIVASLRHVAAALPGRAVAVARELTKLHEEILRGEAEDIADALEKRESVKGEITLLISPPPEDGSRYSDADIDAALAELAAALPASKAASEAAKRFSIAKSDAYARILKLKGDRDA